MIQSIKHISISEPCSQSWDEMTPIPGGRHCTICCKKVTDFTGMSNQQMIEILAKGGNICGKIESWQLESVNRQIAVQQRPPLWKKISVAATILFVITNFKSYGQSKSTPKKHPFIVADKKRVLTDSLKATYVNPKADLSKTDNPEIKPTIIEIATDPVNVLLGGLIVGFKVEETTRHFNNIYDLLINLH